MKGAEQGRGFSIPSRAAFCTSQPGTASSGFQVLAGLQVRMTLGPRRAERHLVTLRMQLVGLGQVLGSWGWAWVPGTQEEGREPAKRVETRTCSTYSQDSNPRAQASE